MKRILTHTADGSTTFAIEGWNEHYHSMHGAIAEAYYVFIQKGLALFPNQEVKILEVGLGTGLNCFISFLEHTTMGQTIIYNGVEAYPINEVEALQLNYVSELSASEHSEIFTKIHTSAWETPMALSSTFTLHKRKQFFEQIEDTDAYHLIYFDAFGARVQPELWTEDIFCRMYKALKQGGVLVTYASKGSARRAMLSAGFQVEKLPGPKGKREMLRATKPTL